MLSKRLVRESVLYTTGNILQKLGDFIFIPLFTFYLTVKEYGYLSLYLSIIPFFLIIFQQGTRTGFIRLYYDYDTSKRHELYTTVLLYNFVSGLILLLTLCVFRNTILPIISSQLVFFPAGILIFLIAMMNNIFLLNLAYFQVEHKVGFYVIYSLICFFFRYGLIILLIAVGKFGLNGYLLGYFAANTILIMIPNVVYLFLKGRCFSFHYLSPLMIFSVPVVPHLLSTWVYNLSSRVIVEKYVSPHDYGVFSLAANISLAYCVLVNSFSLAWAPHYLKTATGADSQPDIILKKNIDMVTRVFSIIFLVFIFFSKELVALAGRKDAYQPAFRLIPFIVLGYFFLLIYVLVANSFYFKKKTLLLSSITVSVAFFSVFNILLFAKHYGIMGASIAMALNYFVLFAVVFFFSCRIYPIPVNKIIFLTVVSGIIFSLILFYINEYLQINFISILSKFCAILILSYVLIGKYIAGPRDV